MPGVKIEEKDGKWCVVDKDCGRCCHTCKTKQDALRFWAAENAKSTRLENQKKKAAK